MSQRRRLMAGNWKMNGLLADGVKRAGELAARARAAKALPEVVLCPPATILGPVGQAIAGSALALGAQDCHAADKGAHTGDLSAPMLAELGCRYVIVGHSERRAAHGETDAQVRAKAEAAQRAGLAPILCVGESRSDREAGRHLDVIARQIEGSLPPGATPANIVVAYEPVWAIGTGLTATAADIAEAHRHLRLRLGSLVRAGAGIRVLYGGSANAGNAAEILAVEGVDGCLVGGASLDAGQFWAMIEAATQ